MRMTARCLRHVAISQAKGPQRHRTSGCLAVKLLVQLVNVELTDHEPCRSRRDRLWSHSRSFWGLDRSQHDDHARIGPVPWGRIH